MEELTLFSLTPEDVLSVYREHGYYFDDTNYINIFRWLWNIKHIHPRIESFPGDSQNRAMVILNNTNTFYHTYDEAIIYVVEYIAKHPNLIDKF